MEEPRVSVRSNVAPRPTRAFGLALGLVLALSASCRIPAHAQAPSAEAGKVSKTSLARYVPGQDLMVYLEFDGLDTHADVWKKTAAYKLLNDTKLGALLEDLAVQGIGLMQKSTPPDKQLKPAMVIDLVKHVAQYGGVFAAWAPGRNPQNAGVVFVARRGDRPDVRQLLEGAAAANFARTGEPEADRAPVQKSGRTYHPIDKEGGWWFEKGDLVISNRPDAVIEVIDGKQLNAVDQPVRTALSRVRDGFQPVATGFIDINALPPMPPDAIRLGFDGLKRIELQWGIQDDALRGVIGVVAPAPRRGILTLLDQPTFNIRSLAPLPAGLTGFSVVSIDLVKTYDRIIELAKQSNPEGADGFAQLEEVIRQRFGFDLRNDLLASLGPKLSLYAQAPGADVAANPAMAMIGQFTGLTISAQVRGDTMARVIDPLITTINRLIQSQQAAARRGQPVPDAEAVAFRKQDGPHPTYVLELPGGALPPAIAAMFRPTLVLGKDQLVFAATTPSADRALDLSGAAPERLWSPTGAFVPMARRLPGELVFLNVSDPRDTMPAMIQSLPMLAGQFVRVKPDMLPKADELRRHLFPASFAIATDADGVRIVSRGPFPSVSSPTVSGVLVGLLLPAVQSAREAARRAQCTNNLKQIGLAMHNYVSANNTFPPPAITDKDGKPLLSWRVAILPYIEQQTLYDRFKLDEPWDSPHNKALIKEMPTTYLCPSRTNAEAGTTTYRVFVGKGALFEEGEGLGIQNVTDGTSNTIMVVESKDAVPWSKPDDLKFDMAAKPSLNGAASSHPGGFNAAFADGSVRFIKNAVNLITFKALITRASGEVVSSDAY